ncbi:hypothetical protein CORC01_12515 [Colletotrichum orchidophilum]|uniref:Uncharacterized protein n=1 Tax=Colletotrichum orchidophilum TaxID=1209926 RepID=A0A1G4ASN6_9PEZI|nr:uncharacterized protein CORC01_12515 [Colletotrichum orchidophilum]OHE92170.1 hypothetical protein CORC01_12515 [Colletotrichum orchidophilum]
MFHTLLVPGGLLDGGTRGSLEYGLVAHRSDSIELHCTPLHSLLLFSSPPVVRTKDVRTHTLLESGSGCAEAYIVVSQLSKLIEGV